MSETRIAAARALAPGGTWTGPVTLAFANGHITHITPGADPHPAGTLTAGLIDLHNNGAFGEDFATATPHGWHCALAALAGRGVTAVQPTLITAPLPAIATAMTAVAEASTTLAAEPVARILGAHLEGQFLSPARRGAHRAEWIQDPSPATLAELLRHPATRRILRTLTLAPERPGALDAIRHLCGEGIIVALGHSDATAAQAIDAADAGATLVTHLFNAMRPLTHRDPGLPAAALTDTRLRPCLIVDGVHVDPTVCRIAFAAAGVRLVAVTDSIVIAGLPGGATRPFGGDPVTMASDGAGRRPGGALAGAGITLDEGVRRMIAAGIDPAAALYAATEAPADAIARPDLGRLAPGARADLIWWDDGWVPRHVWIGGTEVSIEH